MMVILRLSRFSVLLKLREWWKLCSDAVGETSLFSYFVLMAALPEKDPCLGHVAAHRGNASLACFLNRVTHFSIPCTRMQRIC